jgi:hypothetical protein
VRRDLAVRAVRIAVDAALGEVARQIGEALPTLREARSIGISAGVAILQPARSVA